MVKTRRFAQRGMSRTSHEVRGLKLVKELARVIMPGRRTSHEVRGLKFATIALGIVAFGVAPHTRCVD